MDKGSRMLVRNFLYFLLVTIVCVSPVLSEGDCDAKNLTDSNCPKRRLKRYLGFKQGARVFVSKECD